MFEYGEGKFHFVFANQDDDYYPDNLIKMSFIPYLRYRLIEKNFRYIYIFGESYRDPSKGYAVQYVGSQSKTAVAVKKSKGFGFFQGGQQKTTEPNFDIEQEELDGQALSDMMLRVLQFVKKTDHAVAVIPLALFHQHTVGEQVFLEELKKSGTKSIVVLTTSVTAAENDAFFISDTLRFPGGDTPGTPNQGIFWNEGIFPEIRDAFGGDKDSTEKTVFTYTALKRNFGVRMQVWNELSYNSLLNAVRYYFLHSSDVTGVGSAPEFAAVIWAWYNSAVFRDKYPIPFTDNPYRLKKLILNDIARQDIRLRIKEIARLEDAAQTSRFLMRYEQFEETAYIRNASAAGYAQTAFQHFCEVSRGKMTEAGEERRTQLLKLAPLFTPPSYVSAYCLMEPPHLLISGYKSRISSLLEKLRACAVWDCWYAASAQILAEMLIMLAAVMKERCSADPGNQLSGMKLEIAIEAAEYCAKMYARSGMDNEALSVRENTAAVLRLSDAEFEKNYAKIKKELSAAKARNIQI